MGNIDLDRQLDYKGIYQRAVKKAKITGDTLTGLCPFHQDTQSSFSVNLATGQYKCFACNEEGNFVSFYAKQHDITTKDAYKAILEEYHIEDTEKPKGKGSAPAQLYALTDYAKQKKLPAEWLIKTYHLSNKKDRDGEYIDIPYYIPGNDKPIMGRKRYMPKNFRYKKGAKGNIVPYGVWMQETFRKLKYVILVEGESDTQTLHYLGFPAYGIPGAQMFKAEHVKWLDGLDVYIHVEPDQGGQNFLNKTCQGLRDGLFEGNVYYFRTKDVGAAKDPSDLYILHGKDKAQELLRKAKKEAKLIDLKNFDADFATVPGFSLNLRMPDGYLLSEREGVQKVDPKTGAPVTICKTPIIISRRLEMIETGSERIEFEFKRDGKVKKARLDRSTAFEFRRLMTLADQGMLINSNNAREIMTYLALLEECNQDLIPLAEATDRMGWFPGKRFLPYNASDVVLDVDPVMRKWESAYEQNGTLTEWVETIRPYREKSVIFRFILASSFAAPLIEITKNRSFVVYNWGDSRGGKTAALKAALSVWGNPEKLITNFNATDVAIERTAAFFCDLPLGIDERQLAGNRRDEQKSLEHLIYMVAGGQGRGRGSKGGGLQATKEWQTIALTTGEEPLIKKTTQAGVLSRTIEIYGKPFNDEGEASRLHRTVTLNCGLAGEKLIRHLIDKGTDDVTEVYEYIYDTLLGSEDFTGNGSHVASISLVAAGDYISSVLFFGKEKDQAKLEALSLASDILHAQQDIAGGDINEQAVEFVANWIAENRNNFSEKRKRSAMETEQFANVTGKWFGAIADDEVRILPLVLRESLELGGFSYEKTMKYMKENDLIHPDSKGKSTRLAKIDGQVKRMVYLADWAVPPKISGENAEEPPETDDDGFMEITDQTQLPF